MTLLPKPKLGEHATPAEYNYALCIWHKARAEFAIAALETAYNTALKHSVYVNDERALLNIEEHCSQVLFALKRNSEGYAS